MMKKRLFHDLLTDSPIPYSLWKFFLLSIVFHGLLLFLLATMDFTPPEMEITVKRPRQEEDRGISVKFGGSQAGGIPPERAVDRTVRTVDEAPDTRIASVAGNPSITAGSQQPVIVDYYNEEAYPYQAPEPAVVYRHPVPRTNLDIDGQEYMKMYNKPFLDTGKQQFSPLPVRKKNAASYNRVKQYIQHNRVPPGHLVKIEEMVNYFHYDYPLPEKGNPFSVTTEMDTCPWQPAHLLLHIGLQGKIVEADAQLKARDFVVASNLKVRVKFNPDRVKAHRLIGYAHRKPVPGRDSDVREIEQDLRLGQSVTTLYEIIPKDTETTFQTGEEPEIAVVYVWYKDPDNLNAGFKRLSYRVVRKQDEEVDASEDFKFAATVAQFAMLLKNPRLNTIAAIAELLTLAKGALGDDTSGFREDFIKLMEMYKGQLEKR
jgi:hypothetical protein